MQVSSVCLNDRHNIPQLGFGTWQIDDKEAAEKVQFALKAGYRHIDTARIYGNEAGVGAGLAQSGLAREQIYLTTKLWNDDQAYDKALAALPASLQRLQTDYVDLYLIHWPCPAQDLYLEAWQALIELQKRGLARSIGVSNFRVEDLQHIIDKTGIVPAVNQVELHPYFQQAGLRAFHRQYNIATVAYSPLGRGALLNDPVVQKIAEEHGKSAGQIILRWHMEIGTIAIPKSANAGRISDNIHIFDFHLTQENRTAIAALDKKEGKILPQPDERNTPHAL